MGVAIIIPGADFSAKNLGQVTITTEAELTSITITGPTEINGDKGQYIVMYNSGVPSSKKGVAWSVTVGSAYASIDSELGLLTLKTNANKASITIKATSKYDAGVVGTLDIIATYKERGVLDLSSGCGFFTGTKSMDPFTNGGCVVFVGELTGIKGFGNNTYGMSYISGGSASLAPPVYYNMNPIARYTSKINAGGGAKDVYIYTFEAIQAGVMFCKNILFSKSKGIFFDGENKVDVLTTMSGGGESYIGFGMQNRLLGSLTDTLTNESLLELMKAQEMMPTSEHRIIKIKNFLVFTATDYSTVEDVLANRQYADIDLQFNDDDVPYNAGTNKNIKFVYATL